MGNWLSSASEVDPEIKNDKVTTLATPVSIIETETETEEDIFFGYSYFNKDLNFFDNFPTQQIICWVLEMKLLYHYGVNRILDPSVIINKDGAIFYDNVGFINLSNKTLSAAQLILREELSKIYASLKDNDNPTNLTIELGKMKSINIYFSGHIEKPGINIVHPFSDIFSAIIQAGGIDVNGSLREVN